MFLQKGITVITLPLFARLLSTEQYGQVTVYSSWFGIMQMILTLNLAYGSLSTAMVKFEKDRKGYIASAEGICILLSTLFLIIYLPFDRFFNQLFELPTKIVCVMVAEIFATTSLLLWNGRKRFEYKYKGILGISIVMAVASPLFQFVLVSINSEKGYAYIIGGAIVNITIGLIIFLYNSFAGKKLICGDYWKFAFGFNLPLLIYYFSQTIFNQSDRIMISHMVGTDKAAIYGVAYMLSIALSFILTAINYSYVPWFYERIKEQKTGKNKKVSLKLAIIVSLILLLFIWFAPEVILVMAGSKYVESIYVIPPVTISMLLLFYTQLFCMYAFYYEAKKELIIPAVMAAVINLLLNWIFIGKYGFIAAAYTTLVSYLLLAIMSCILMKKIIMKNEIPDDGYNYWGLLLLFIGFTFASIIGTLFYGNLVLRVVLLLVISVVVFLNRKRLKLRGAIDVGGSRIENNG